MLKIFTFSAFYEESTAGLETGPEAGRGGGGGGSLLHKIKNHRGEVGWYKYT